MRKAAAWLAKERPTERYRLINREEGCYPVSSGVLVVQGIKIRVLLLARPALVTGGRQEGGAGHHG